MAISLFRNHFGFGLQEGWKESLMCQLKAVCKYKFLAVKEFVAPEAEQTN